MRRRIAGCSFDGWVLAVARAWAFFDGVIPIASLSFNPRPFFQDSCSEDGCERAEVWALPLRCLSSSTDRRRRYSKQKGKTRYRRSVVRFVSLAAVKKAQFGVGPRGSIEYDFTIRCYTLTPGGHQIHFRPVAQHLEVASSECASLVRVRSLSGRLSSLFVCVRLERCMFGVPPRGFERQRRSFDAALVLGGTLRDDQGES